MDQGRILRRWRALPVVRHPSSLRDRLETMLSGTYIYGMDRKGRVVMPAGFRQALGAPFVLTRAPGSALLALSSPQWKVLVDRYESSTLFRGYYLSAAVECG